VNFLSLFSGIGLHDLGFERAGWRCVGQVELDPFAAAVLAKHWPHVPRWCDVRSVTVDAVRGACGRIDAICGGFMCTDISVAGKGAGLGKRTRSGLTWREMFRLIRGLRPVLLVIENVPRLRTLGADRVLAALERIGYACRALVVGAEHVGAPHRRHRVWIVGPLAQPANGTPEDFIRRKQESVARGSKMGIALTDLNLQVQVAARGERTTPNAHDGSRGAETRDTKKARGAGGVNLLSQIVWQTPSASTAEAGCRSRSGKRKDELLLIGQVIASSPEGAGGARTWPTPRAIDGRPKGNGPRPDTLTGIVNYGPQDPATPNTPGKRLGSLNPEWVAQLQGAPDGWLDLPDATLCELWETATRRKSRKR
jgi:DNA-cytosine methyltransferase